MRRRAVQCFFYRHPFVQKALVWVCLRLTTLFPNYYENFYKFIKEFAPQLEMEFLRQKLIRELKANRYTWTRGPLWLRALNELWLRYKKVNRFLIALIVKVFLASICIGGPLCLLLIARGTLPVPERIKSPDRPPITPLSTPRQWSFVFHATPGKAKTLSFNDSPGTMSSFKGFKMNAGESVVFTNGQANILEDQNDYTIFQRFQLLQGRSNTCHISVKDHREMVIWTSQTTENQKEEPYRGAWLSGDGHVQVSQKNRKKRGRWALFSLSKNIPFYSIEVKNDNSQKCAYGVGEPRVISEISGRPLQNKPSWVVVAVDGYPLKDFEPLSNHLKETLQSVFQEGALLASHTLPDLNLVDFLLDGGMWSLGNSFPLMKLPSVNSSLRESQSTHTVASAFIRSGARTGAIGFFNPLVADWNPVELGFEDVFITTNRHFESRITTELALDWLQEFGAGPFFLLARYGALRDPIRPPWRLLNIFEYLGHVWSPLRERVLFEGGLSMMQEELGRLLNGIEKLSLSSDVGILVMSTSATNQRLRGISIEGEFPDEIVGLVRQGGHFLGRDELFLPYMIIPPRQGFPPPSKTDLMTPNRLGQLIRAGTPSKEPKVLKDEKKPSENEMIHMVSSTTSLGVYRPQSQKLSWWQPWPREARVFSKESPWGSNLRVQGLLEQGSQSPQEVFHAAYKAGFSPVIHLMTSKIGPLKGVFHCALPSSIGAQPSTSQSPGVEVAPQEEGELVWLTLGHPLSFHLPASQAQPAEFAIPPECSRVVLELTEGEVHLCGELGGFKRIEIDLHHFSELSLSCKGFHPQDRHPQIHTLWWGLAGPKGFWDET